MRKCKKIWKAISSAVLVVVMACSSLNTVTVLADDEVTLGDFYPDMDIENAYPEVEQIGDESVAVYNNAHECDLNTLGSIGALPSEISVCSEMDDSNENTNPNNAYLVQNENIVQGNLGQSSEMRWYAFILDQESKITIELQTVATVDADLYMFELDQDTYQLSLIGGSASEGYGNHEQYIEVLGEGIYYFAVTSYDGFGQYAFGFYSTGDVINEVNDSTSSATNIGVNENVAGVIDSPYDMDYYTFSLDEPALMNMTWNALDYQVNFVMVDENSHIYLISDNDNLYQFSAGTYYIKVRSSQGNYSEADTYSISLNKIANIADNPYAFYYMVNDRANIIFQCDANGNNMYVNGNPIDVSYAYNVNASNSAGGQRYNITMTNSSSLRAKIYQNQFMYEDAELTSYMGMTMPDTVNYMWGTKGVGPTGNVLELSLYSLDPVKFYQIHCVCSGAYAANNFYRDLNFATVFIDPNTGRLVDIQNINYFYDIATGSNNMMFTRPYSTHTKYYYPYYDGNEPTSW